MITELAQRWRSRRERYRPAGETIVPAEYDVAPLDELPAKAFVLEHHYSASYPAARFRYGLFRRGQIAGVAVFSHPANQRVLSVFGGDPGEHCELGRLVLLDEVPGNGESWFIARAFTLLRAEGIAGVVSFSDPVARRSAAGTVVHPGHLGVIYQATNAVYAGRATARTLRLLPDGRVFSERAMSKIRSGERGWRYAMALLVAHGARPWNGREDRRKWLARWVARITRPLPHPGNHRYLFALDRALRRTLPPSLPYPRVFG